MLKSSSWDDPSSRWSPFLHQLCSPSKPQLWTPSKAQLFSPSKPKLHHHYNLNHNLVSEAGNLQFHSKTLSTLARRAWEWDSIGNLHWSVAVFYCLSCRILISAAVPPDQQCKLQGCIRLKYVEPGGRVHDFCGRTHANQYAMQQNPSKLTPGPLMLELLKVQNTP